MSRWYLINFLKRCAVVGRYRTRAPLTPPLNALEARIKWILRFRAHWMAWFVSWFVIIKRKGVWPLQMLSDTLLALASSSLWLGNISFRFKRRQQRQKQRCPLLYACIWCHWFPYWYFERWLVVGADVILVQKCSTAAFHHSFSLCPWFIQSCVQRCIRVKAFMPFLCSCIIQTYLTQYARCRQ